MKLKRVYEYIKIQKCADSLPKFDYTYHDLMLSVCMSALVWILGKRIKQRSSSQMFH